MQLEIRRLPPGAAARVVAAVAGIAALIVTVVSWLTTLPLPGLITIQGVPISLAVFVVPLGWWLTFYVATLCLCALYNLLAKHFGGIVFETVEAPVKESAA